MTKVHHMKTLHQMKTFYKSYFKDWGSIYDGLRLPSKHCAVANKYFGVNDGEMATVQCGKELEIQLRKSENFRSKPLDRNSSSERKEVGETQLKVFVAEWFRTPYARIKNNTLPYYLLDLASILPVLILDIQEDDRVLDMCAAPGGKTVTIMQLLSGRGNLVCNDYTKQRYNRLKKVVKEYIPYADSTKSNITTTNWNGELFGNEERNSFDKVLVDAPCSSERHVIQKEFQFGGWSIRKMNDNSKLQTKLLLSAMRAAKPGGSVVYSTCSISPIENDNVVQSVLELCQQNHVKVSVDNTICEETIHRFPGDTFFHHRLTYGVLILPTFLCNWGPMYVSKLSKLQ